MGNANLTIVFLWVFKTIKWPKYDWLRLEMKNHKSSLFKRLLNKRIINLPPTTRILAINLAFLIVSLSFKLESFSTYDKGYHGTKIN